MRIYILRHGETDWNLVRRLQGSVDIELNATGVRQAESWRPYFDAVSLAGVYSSTLRRAIRTAELATGRSPIEIDDLRERSFGIWEGVRWDDLSANVSGFDHLWRSNSYTPEGGESREAMYDRVGTAVRRIVAQHNEEHHILVVAHGGSGRAVMCTLMGYSIDERNSWPVLQNASLTIMESKGTGWAIVPSV